MKTKGIKSSGLEKVRERERIESSSGQAGLNHTPVEPPLPTVRRTRESRSLLPRELVQFQSNEATPVSSINNTLRPSCDLLPRAVYRGICFEIGLTLFRQNVL